jgi:predicted flap endonuclease-1-like 5' DNA nuclease
MNTSEMKDGPRFEMWVIGAAAGLVAAAVMIVVGGYGWMAAAFVGVMIAAVVAFVFGLPKAAPPSPMADDAVLDDVVSDTHAAVAPAVARPMADVAPVAFVSQPAAPAPLEAKTDGPERLSGPRMGRADNLKEIEGIGPAMEKLVNELGFYHFDQIASWSDADVAWVDANMKNFKGRIVRDRWVAQAKLIVSEGLEAFRVRAQTNNY